MSLSQIRGIVQLAFSLESKMKKTMSQMEKFIITGINSLKVSEPLENPREKTDCDQLNEDPLRGSPTYLLLSGGENPNDFKSSGCKTDLIKARVETEDPESLSQRMSSTKDQLHNRKDIGSKSKERQALVAKADGASFIKKKLNRI